MKLKCKIDYAGLEKYIRSLDISEVQTNWQKPENAKLIEGYSVDEIGYFNPEKAKTIKEEKLINYGEPFLVDAIGNDLSVVILSRRKYKLPTGRAVKAKFVATVISDCRALFGTPLNGYWKIPNQFISPLK